jgi:hypothetical protein
MASSTAAGWRRRPAAAVERLFVNFFVARTPLPAASARSARPKDRKRRPIETGVAVQVVALGRRRDALRN